MRHIVARTGTTIAYKPIIKNNYVHTATFNGHRIKTDFIVMFVANHYLSFHLFILGRAFADDTAHCVRWGQII